MNSRSPQILDIQLRNIADTLEGDLKRSQYSGRTITLCVVSPCRGVPIDAVSADVLFASKLKHDTYEVASRAMTFGKAAYVSDADTLYRFVFPSAFRSVAHGQGIPAALAKSCWTAKSRTLPSIRRRQREASL